MASLAPGSRSLVGGWMDRSHFQILTPADLKTCDLGGIWSEWWGDMTGVMGRHDRTKAYFPKVCVSESFWVNWTQTCLPWSYRIFWAFFWACLKNISKKSFFSVLGNALSSPPLSSPGWLWQKLFSRNLKSAAWLQTWQQLSNAIFVFWKYCKKALSFSVVFYSYKFGQIHLHSAQTHNLATLFLYSSIWY